MATEEGERVLAEVRDAAQRRADRAAEKGKAAKAKGKLKPKAARKPAKKHR